MQKQDPKNRLEKVQLLNIYREFYIKINLFSVVVQLSKNSKLAINFV